MGGRGAAPHDVASRTASRRMNTAPATQNRARPSRSSSALGSARSGSSFAARGASRAAYASYRERYGVASYSDAADYGLGYGA